ncbi:AMP-binding protein, partial [Micromonospora sp. NPDC051296]|uniref:AMP-binding protein n=1 Tax=Micromonospora sp. NPDC051296 TaxID=3155046 RepID=UPI00343D426F
MDPVTSPASVLVPPGQLDLWQRLNDTPEPAAASIADRVAAIAHDDPDRPAVIAARRQLSYAELHHVARAVAERIAVERDTHRCTAVSICVEPGWEQVVAVTAATIAGVAWHAVDPAAAQSARWQHVKDRNSRLVLTQSWLDERLRWPPEVTRLLLDEEQSPNPTRDHLPAPDPVACWVADDHGRPVPVSRVGVSSLVAELQTRLGLSHDDRVLAVCPLGSELAATAIFAMLAVGGAVVVPDDIDIRVPATWVDLVRQHDVTVWHSTPTLAAMLVEHLHHRGDDLPDTLRLALLGGEPLPLPVVTELRRLIGDELRVVNLGPGTVGGLWSTLLEIGEPDRRRGHLPVGAPLPGRRVYLLSESLTLCPAWVSGQLHVGGPVVADLPDQPGHPPVTRPDTGERVYRCDYTGRLLPDGVIDLLGEDDSQTDVSGHPLNLRDVEAALTTHPAVLTAAVLPDGAGSVAYVKALPGSQLTSVEVLAHLRRKMSPFLLPERVELVGALPLTRDGRTDRHVLASRSGVVRAAAVDVPSRATAPADLIARACRLAARILGVADVDPDMNLVDLGANSVQLVRLATQAEQELGIQVDVDELLRFPSVGVLVSVSLAAADDTGGPAGTDVPGDPLAHAPESDSDGILILDPVARVEFTSRRPGIRRDLAEAATVALPGGAPPEWLAGRRTTRRFGPAQVSLDALGHLLSAVARLDIASGPDGPGSGAGGNPRYGYPSAGTLYPVQVYLTTGPRGVAGLDPGAFYYHPERHELTVVNPGGEIGDEAHAWVNRPAVRTSSFA